MEVRTERPDKYKRSVVHNWRHRVVALIPVIEWESHLVGKEYLGKVEATLNQVTVL